MASISYKKLWYRLIDDNISKTELRHATGISSSTLANMKNGKNVSMEVLLKICESLHCTINDITEIVYDDSEDSELLKTQKSFVCTSTSGCNIKIVFP